MSESVVHRGEDAIYKICSRIAARTSNDKQKNVVIIHGRSFAQQIQDCLAWQDSKSAAQIFLKSNIPQNPNSASIQRICRELPMDTLDLVVAIGGGSIIDTAKILVAFAGGATEDELLNNQFSLKSKPAFWVAPTTAGSGSEATHFAVVYKEKKKFSIAHTDLRAQQIFLDPTLAVSCPPLTTLASGVDAMCQAIESSWAPTATVESGQYALEGLQLVVSNLPRVIKSPEDVEARNGMLEGAHLAGRAIDITKTTAGHALSYGITSELGLPHGVAVLLVMGPLIECMDQKYEYFSKQGSPSEKIFSKWGADFVTGFLVFRKLLLQTMPLPTQNTTWRESPPKMVAKLMTGLNVERMRNHPIPLEQDDVYQIFQSLITELDTLRMHK